MTAVIETVAQTGSTNADLAARLAGGEAFAEGYWLRAETQTGGRGRLGRQWQSVSGNLHCSTVVNVRPGDPPAHTLSLVAGLAAHDMLSGALGQSSRCQLKWPNDVLLDRAKLAGILCERRGNAVIIGIGVNVATAPDVEGQQTAAMAAYDADIDAASALENLAAHFSHRLSEWRMKPLADTTTAWEERAHPRGTPLSVIDDGRRLSGAFDGLDPDGALRLRLPDGSSHAIHAGDVTLDSGV